MSEPLLNDGDYIGDSPAYRYLSVSKLQEACNPFEAWCEEPIPTVDKVRQKVTCLKLRAEPYKPGSSWSSDQHMERIAYLVVHGWEDPIEVDFGIPTLGYVPGWLVTDGNHRFAAAIVRGDASIKASCGGQVSEIMCYVADNLV